MLTPFNTLGNVWPETQGFADLTVNLLLSVTNSYIDKLDLSFQDQRFRNFQKGCEMGPFDSIILILKKRKDHFSGVSQWTKK